MTEEELEQIAARLGSAEVRELDGERLTQAVLARLAAEPAAPSSPVHRFSRRWIAGLAAAAAVLLALRLTLPSSSAPATGGDHRGSNLTVLHELDDLDTGELEALLESLPPSATDASHPEPASFDDLDSRNLERLLRSLEG